MDNFNTKDKNMRALLALIMLMIVGCSTLTIERSFDYPVDSFTKIEMFIEIDGEYINFQSGSGSVIGQRDGFTIVLSAAHVCENYSASMTAMMNNSELTLRAHGHDAIIIDLDHEIDVCVLGVKEGLEDFRPLIIARDAPEQGDKAFTVSSPLGIADIKHGLIGLYHGKFLGNTDFGEDTLFSVYSIPTAPGSSGSPIMNKDAEVVGITSMGHPTFNSAAISPTHEEFFEFVTEVLRKH